MLAHRGVSVCLLERQSRVGGCIANFEHLGNWSHAGNGLFRELANAERDRAGQLSIEINGAAAHAGDYPGVVSLRATKPHQDDVTFGAIGIFEHAKDFNIHGLGLSTLKNGVSHALHPDMNLGDGNGVHTFGGLSAAYFAENQEGY